MPPAVLPFVIPFMNERPVEHVHRDDVRKAPPETVEWAEPRSLVWSPVEYAVDDGEDRGGGDKEDDEANHAGWWSQHVRTHVARRAFDCLCATF